MRLLAIAAMMVVLAGAGAAEAGQIRQACLTSDRDSNPRLCSCIQMAADQTLSAKDQKVAASFFVDPDKAEEMRMSDRRSHEAFWDRYKRFGSFAASLCS